MHITWQILLQIILIALNAVFACAEIAVISFNENKLDELIAEKNKRAIKLGRLTEQPARFLATIQVAITLSGFLGSAFAADNFADPIVDWLIRLGTPIPESTLNTLSVILITIILSYFTLVFGELVPKRLAMKKAEQLALGLSSLLSFVSKIFAPIVWLLTVSTNKILLLCGIDPNAEESDISEEEIRTMAAAGSRKGVIDAEENTFIQNIFAFDDLRAGDFATHRTELCVLWTDQSLDDWEQIIHETRHSKYPVCDETIDDIHGILDIKDYFGLSEKTVENAMKYAVKPAFFVPETVRADVLFKQMKQTHQHFSVVLDEYGGTSGIITMSDLLEQLVGDLNTSPEDKSTQEHIQQLSENTWRVGGSVSLDEVAETLHISLPLEDYDTFSGYVFGMYGSIPNNGIEIALDTDSFQIKNAMIKDHRLQSADILLKETPEIEAEK